MTRRLLREDVTLRTMLDPSIAKVKVDVGQIEQVILNLSVNARDAMPSGGTLTIQTGMTTVARADADGDGAVPPGRYVTLRVSDTGSGMDEATVGRIFEPFFTTKPEGHGTGLGLATVFGIVRQSGGHITVTSRVGRGTTFTVYLPPYEEEGALSEAGDGSGARPQREQGRETILLVEDEAQVRKLMEGILRRAGYQVVNAPSASAALKASSQHEGPIDLLVTDVIMPRMSGPQLAERFRSDRPDARVLYISGYMDVSVLDPRGREFLRKPFTPEGLLKRVREVLDGGIAGASYQGVELEAR
jgi:CheY-like chemotaxis protein